MLRGHKCMTMHAILRIRARGGTPTPARLSRPVVAQTHGTLARSVAVLASCPALTEIGLSMRAAKAEAMPTARNLAAGKRRTGRQAGGVGPVGEILMCWDVETLLGRHSV